MEGPPESKVEVGRSQGWVYWRQSISEHCRVHEHALLAAIWLLDWEGSACGFHCAHATRVMAKGEQGIGEGFIAGRRARQGDRLWFMSGGSAKERNHGRWQACKQRKAPTEQQGGAAGKENGMWSPSLGIKACERACMAGKGMSNTAAWVRLRGNNSRG